MRIIYFEADVIEGQKTGFFLDQRDNRARVRELANDKQVVDVFAASGGFSVYAAAAGAKSVLSIDASQPALDAARRNMALNRRDHNVAQIQHDVVVGDAFATLFSMANAQSNLIWLFSIRRRLRNGRQILKMPCTPMHG